MPMNLKEDIKPISYIKAHAADILDQINETKRPLFVTQNGEAKAVLMDTESYEGMQNALGLLKLLAQGEKDILNKNFTKQEEFFSSIEKRLKK
jgi:prevent-host-death family protein